MKILEEKTKDAVITCALRFDGYRYAEEKGDGELLGRLSPEFVRTLRMAEVEDENHAVFFALQRYLFKWGGDMLPQSAREHWAFRYLFKWGGDMLLSLVGTTN